MRNIRKSLLGISIAENIIRIRKPFPLMGHIGFGLIDRGFNNIQARVTSLCPLACIFCSVDAGRASNRKREFLVIDVEWFVRWIKSIIEIKGPIHVLYDAAGDPITNPYIIDFIRETKTLEGVLSVSLETRLFPPNKKLIEKLDEAGLDRINVSIDALDPQLARELTGTPIYDVRKIMNILEYIHDNTSIDVHITPLWIPGVNDEEIEKIIEWVKQVGFGRKWPPLGIQKYVIHKHGRKVPRVKEWSWSFFFKKLKELEEKHGIKLILSQNDFRVKKSNRVPVPYKKGDVVKLIIYTQAWWSNEYITTTYRRDWVITLLDRKNYYEPGDVVIGKIINDKDGILLAVPV